MIHPSSWYLYSAFYSQSKRIFYWNWYCRLMCFSIWPRSFYIWKSFYSRISYLLYISLMQNLRYFSKVYRICFFSSLMSSNSALSLRICFQYSSIMASAMSSFSLFYQFMFWQSFELLQFSWQKLCWVLNLSLIFDPLRSEAFQNACVLSSRFIFFNNSPVFSKPIILWRLIMVGSDDL